MTPNIENGSWKVGGMFSLHIYLAKGKSLLLICSEGALLNGVPKDDKPESLDFFGSTLVIVADSAEDIRSQLSKDIYATSGVWDLEKVDISNVNARDTCESMLMQPRSKSTHSSAPSGFLERKMRQERNKSIKEHGFSIVDYPRLKMFQAKLILTTNAC